MPNRLFSRGGWSGGFDGGLGYLRRNVEKRFSPAELMPGARSVVVCGVSYKNDTSLGYGDTAVPKVASYARSGDYHVAVKEMLYETAARLGLKEDGTGFRAFTDTAPLLEKRLACEAGLGFIGRNTLLVSPRYGSFLLLGELVVDVPVDIYDRPYEGIGCGACRRCVEHCPAGALTGEGLDARRCISRLTVEPHPERVPALAQRIGLLRRDGYSGVTTVRTCVPITSGPLSLRILASGRFSVRLICPPAGGWR